MYKKANIEDSSQNCKKYSIKGLTSAFNSVLFINLNKLSVKAVRFTKPEQSELIISIIFAFPFKNFTANICESCLVTEGNNFFLHYQFY